MNVHAVQFEAHSRIHQCECMNVLAVEFDSNAVKMMTEHDLTKFSEHAFSF